ncbi:hypothetical protein [Sphingobium sp.]
MPDRSGALIFHRAWFSAIILVAGDGRAQGLIARPDMAGASVAQARGEGC